ncbi:MAG: sugar phosphorylase [Rhodopirellula sp.]|nr:sugar phosphorylase [Rhodopirellula sp.]OUX49242.1 MAG: sugar phosphorylase [Rhodopirellula sp. TMED283]
MEIDSTTSDLIQQIYGELPEVLIQGLEKLSAAPESQSHDELWCERDVVLITYADQVRSSGLSPLQAQKQFLLDHDLEELIRCVHLLPFCPFTSDDGFSVVDYLAVDPDVGTWQDIAELGQDFDLMFDLVLNHASQKHAWFQAYLRGEDGFEDFFIDQDPMADLSKVVRPRSLPLLTPFESSKGTRNVWTTFSADQVDLNYANPRVMYLMLETLVEYARRGARIIRLDAIAFLWKEPGTECIHLPRTHAAVKLMRRILDKVVPGTLVLTETNVPHQENVSYFGNGHDEAHMVYQFSLPPLLLDAIHNADTSVLRDWLSTIQPPTEATTFFNFTASHDGVGVRPLEGIVSQERVERLATIVRSHGGRVSTRRQSDGTDSPYELNITYLEAVADSSKVEPQDHSRCFLATQAIMLSLPGIPAVYFHSLVGSPNDLGAVSETGQNRRINRHKYDRQDLEDVIARPQGLQCRVFEGYRRLLSVRISQSAFHPKASMEVLPLSGDGLLGFIRTAVDGQRLAVLANLTHSPRVIPGDLVDSMFAYDELASERFLQGDGIPMRPFQVRWLTAN